MHPAFDKRVFDKEAITLVEAGHEVVHLCPGDYANAGVHRGVKVVTYAPPSGIVGRIKQLYTLYSMAKSLDSDAYHCNEIDSWLVGVLLKITCGKLCIFDVHEDYPSTFAESRFPLFVQPLIKILIRLFFLFLVPFTDKLVLAKKTVGGDYPFSKGKHVLVRNFTPRNGVKSPVPIDKFQNERFKVVHLGLFNRKRGWPQTLEAMSVMNNKNLDLIVIGTFDDGSKDDFLRRAKELGLQHRIEVHGWLPFDEAFQFLLEAQIGLVAFQPGIKNHIRAMPHKMFDYMAAEAVVLCPDFSIEVAPYIVSSNSGFLFDSANPADLAEKFDFILSNPSNSQLLARNGRQAIERIYNWEFEAEKLLDMYRGLANK